MKSLNILFFCIPLFSLAQKLETVGGAVNTEYAEIHPLIAQDGKTLYFVRVSHPSNNFGKDGSNDVWFSDLVSGSWTVGRKMSNSINKDQYNNLFSISPDGNSALINGVFENGRIKNEVGISVSKKKGVTWQQPQKIDIPKLDDLVKGQFFSACMSNSQKVLLFAFSEKKNSKNDDIYYSLLEKNGKWTKPQSIGPVVNSSDSEITPFLAADDQTLYFATDRKGGEGGFDIWVSKRTGRSWETWTKPLNLGKVINSKEDELYYTIEASGQYAYLSSKNNSVGKSDLFRIRLIEEKKKVDETAVLAASQNSKNTNDEKDKNEAPSLLAPNTVILISGIVKDLKTNRPIEAKIVYEDLENGEELGEATSNPTTGEYRLSLPYGKRYAIRAEAKDFISVSKNIDLSQKGEFKEIKGEDLFIAPIQAGLTVAMNNIFFKFGRSDLEEVSFFELDRMAEMLTSNPTMIIDIQGHTDNVGSAEANLKLSQERADAVRTYFLSKKVKPEKVKSTGFGETKPIASNANTEGQAKNRRVEFEIVRK